MKTGHNKHTAIIYLISRKYKLFVVSLVYAQEIVQECLDVSSNIIVFYISCHCMNDITEGCTLHYLITNSTLGYLHFLIFSKKLGNVQWLDQIMYG